MDKLSAENYTVLIITVDEKIRKGLLQFGCTLSRLAPIKVVVAINLVLK
jgi:hypothetical protein